MADSSVGSAGDDLASNVESSQFTIHTRVAATKPLTYMYRLLALPPDTAIELAAATDNAISASSDEASGVAFIHVSTAFQQDALGLRVGMHVSDEEHLLVVDAALEYAWVHPPSYQREAVESFLELIAAPRATASAWTIVEELARAVGAELPTHLVIPPGDIANLAMQQFDQKMAVAAKQAAERRSATGHSASPG
ncbi:hypothetical protein HZU40_25060 [Mycolicibacterium fluoranthenivorans]|uniref:Preprotein translocase subunit SecB n=1 Tax=Mycolicibacterium fluoranthenivorans TaxID=258505 RepID=A0A7G8PAS6_9MYCO|nr:hypothetical protein [Mycolicibacterium fluoranthenivorans]QNJ91442.1 hypothetical protein HZU40_25060 [Mycolicibacterium fluoranthenivorans]